MFDHLSIQYMGGALVWYVVCDMYASEQPRLCAPKNTDTRYAPYHTPHTSYI